MTEKVGLEIAISKGMRPHCGHRNFVEKSVCVCLRGQDFHLRAGLAGN
jgi:hypothetical protein